MNKQGNICTLFEKKTILWLCAAMVTLICYMILAATNKIVFLLMMMRIFCIHWPDIILPETQLTILL